MPAHKSVKRATRRKQVARRGSAPKSSRAQTFEELIARYETKIAATAAALRRLVKETLPALDENIYGGSKSGLALYSRGKTSNVICGIGPSAACCLVYVHHAEGLGHAGLKIEGQGRHCVHIKFANAAEINAGALREFLSQAAARAPK